MAEFKVKRLKSKSERKAEINNLWREISKALKEDISKIDEALQNGATVGLKTKTEDVELLLTIVKIKL